ncbi:MAG TPA: efflux RND transporter periplasmic adaptor subunit [Methylomirabilota bacterium]|nr:efflux RND transporter periplasmic adaptor subunit [Methylomirabilota bacterium]
MAKGIVVVVLAAALGAGGYWYAVHAPSPTGSAVAQAPQGPRPVSVEIATAVKKNTPVLLEGLGNVTTMASVAVKTRLDNEIVGVHFADGARVNKGDLLFTLDTRSIEAQMRQVEGNIARDQAQLDGAARDVRRYTELVAKAATPVTNLENAQTQLATFSGALKADQAALENLKVQLTFCTIRAPISGRISMAAVKVGNFVRSADTAPMAVINQTSPVYVTFTIPQKNLPDIRHALAAETANVEVIIPGESKRATGAVTMIENAVDLATGMAMVRATIPNQDELLWPGTLVTAQMTLRTETAVAVPSAAVQVSQAGPFVYVVKDRKAVVQGVKIARTVGNETVLSEGLDGGETVITEGHLLLTNGAAVTVREHKAGA